MTDSDDKLLRRYRSLSREEPPRALDEAILAASRRAVARPTLARRWAAPVSIAAVLVLAFGVTLEMQREQPGVEYKEPARRETYATAPGEPSPAAPPAAGAPQVAAAPRDKALAERRSASPAPARKPVTVAPEEARPFPGKPALDTMAAPRFSPTAPPPAEPAAASDSLKDATAFGAPAAASESRKDANAAPAAPARPASATMAAPLAKRAKSDAAPAAAALAPQSAEERELERIARLREAGSPAEADKALEEFRRAHPDFRIPEAMWERVKPR
jgi:hypothetical protein